MTRLLRVLSATVVQKLNIRNKSLKNAIVFQVEIIHLDFDVQFGIKNPKVSLVRRSFYSGFQMERGLNSGIVLSLSI